MRVLTLGFPNKSISTYLYKDVSKASKLIIGKLLTYFLNNRQILETEQMSSWKELCKNVKKETTVDELIKNKMFESLLNDLVNKIKTDDYIAIYQSKDLDQDNCIYIRTQTLDGSIN